MQNSPSVRCFYFYDLIFIMKLLLIAVLAILATAHAVEEAGVEHDYMLFPNVEHEYMFFPDGDGVPQLIDLKERVEWSAADVERNVNTIRFTLFTRNNPTHGQDLTINQISSVTNSHFNRNNPTRILTHGWRSSGSSNACLAPRDSYLAVGNYNVIIVDWSQIAGQLYGTASGQVRNVAAHVAAFLNFMNQQAGLNWGTTMTIGHSLGGHIAGIAAREAWGNLQGVVALDPALPGFDNAGAGSGIHRDDASNVQVVHTNGGTLGLSRAAGDSDFYPNGGSSQPGCGIDLVGSCAHSRAYYYFAESIRNPTGFRATGVNNVFMGGRSLTTARGSFWLNTAANAPFALG